jgi:benzylsuccinate CoA-transferase BbsF subunit
MHLTGYPDGPPVRGGAGGFGVAFTDVAGAYYGSYSVLAALEYRERTGQGLWLDLSHYEAGVATLPEPILDYTMNGRVALRAGNRRFDRAPQGVYPCAGDDEWIAISIASGQQFHSLAEILALNLPLMQFETLAARQHHHDLIDELIARATSKQPSAALESKLQDAGVEATRLISPKDVWLDAQMRARGFGEIVPAPTYAPDIGARVYPRPAWLMSQTPASTRSPAPAFGQHNHEVLGGLLGLKDEEIAELTGLGVIADAPRPGMIAPRQLDLDGLLAANRLREIDPDFESRLHAQFGQHKA